MFFDRPDSGSRAVLVHVRFSTGDDAIEIAEFEDLVRAADIVPLTLVTARRQRPDARHFVGRGKLDEVRTAIAEQSADLVVFDHELSPGQQRNLETELKLRVVTRTELILGIFASRARTHEGQLQVELAQLRHAQTRLVRGWTHLDRQKGGIGLRGAGETQIEMDQRVLTERVRAIEKRLAKVRTQRDQGRRQRQRTATRTIALVGYTNAGKSTLFNRLTTAEVFAADRLFATLDPTLRKLELDGAPDMVLADTVGFVRHLPHSLVEAFKATLEEVVQADLLLHVLDASAPDVDEQSQQVHAVLEEIGAADRPLLEVNKIDRIGAAPELERDADGRPSRIWMSAVTGSGVELLGAAIAERLNLDALPMRVHLSPSAQKTRSWLYRLGAVMHETSAEDGGSELTVRLDRERLAQLERQPGVLLPAPQGVHRISPSR